MRIKIASRKSDLARLQSYMVGQALNQKYPDMDIDFEFSASLGDKNQNDPLWKMPSQGVFTEDLRQRLISGSVDMVVHSWKDLPVDSDGLTVLASTLERADHRDLLLVKKSALPNIMARKTLKLLSSSPRRMHNLNDFLKNAMPGGLQSISFEDVRGNIQTRLNKMLAQDEEGLVVAKAAIDRLLVADQFNQWGDEFSETARKISAVIDKCVWMVMPASHNPPAAAQGALVVEIAKGRTDLAPMLEAINCARTFLEVEQERQILKSHGGGCHQKIGVWVSELETGRITSLRGETETGSALKEYSLRHADGVIGDKPAIFASPVKGSEMFDRVGIAVSENARHALANSTGLFVASSFVPQNYLEKTKGKILWTSGVKSWFNLAQKGFWVNGCDDNLGADAPRRLTQLHGGQVRWANLTHADSPREPKIPTYSLVTKKRTLDLGNATHFYWRSGSIFERVLALKPKIAEGVHACGLGQTYKTIRAILGDDAKILPFLSEEDWLTQMGELSN